jgi:hypothetical protein
LIVQVEIMSGKFPEIVTVFKYSLHLQEFFALRVHQFFRELQRNLSSNSRSKNRIPADYKVAATLVNLAIFSMPDSPHGLKFSKSTSTVGFPEISKTKMHDVDNSPIESCWKMSAILKIKDDSRCVLWIRRILGKDELADNTIFPANCYIWSLADLKRITCYMVGLEHGIQLALSNTGIPNHSEEAKESNSAPNCRNPIESIGSLKLLLPVCLLLGISLFIIGVRFDSYGIDHARLPYTIGWWLMVLGTMLVLFPIFVLAQWMLRRRVAQAGADPFVFPRRRYPIG